MSEYLLIGGASLLLGMRHATDPDHLLAVSTILCRERSLLRAARVGAIWGLGHSVTVAVFGGAIVAFRIALAPRVGLALEFVVALMLILLGALTLLRRDHAPERFTPFRPFLVGVVHGLAGSAAAVLVVLSTIANARWAIGFLFVFGAGTLVGMSIMTCLLAAPSLFAPHNHMRAPSWLRLVSGALTLGLGCYLAYRTGIVDGLFTGDAHWTPV